MPSPGILVTLKALFQLGPGPLSLYGLYRLGLATGHYRRLERAGLTKAESFSALHPLFSLPTQKELLKILGKDGQAGLLKEADEIVSGKVRLFGGEPVPLQLAFEGPLRHWTDYATGKAALPLSHAARSRSAGLPPADVKFIWEPARFGWAYTLARAYWATKPPSSAQDGRGKRPKGQRPPRSKAEVYAEAFWTYFEQFTKANPPCCGPDWMNGQEVAIRLLALVWCGQVFDEAAATTPARRSALVRSVAQHAARIPPTLVYARSQNNNHLLTESAALYTAGVALDDASWRELGWRWLNRGLRSQVSSYGEYIQHSSNYHRLVLQTALWVDANLRGRGSRWPASTLASLARASHWLFSMLDPVSGRAPNLGPNDGALILPLSSSAYDDYRPTVQAAARAFLRTSLPAGPWDELSLWLSLPAGKHTAGSQAYVGDQLRGRDSWAYLRATQFRSRLSHMDQLHFDLWWRGSNLAQDAGTYLYDAPRPWDNPLVSTRVHNTVTVDGRDQMTRGGRFLTLDWFPAYSKSLIPVDDLALGSMLAYHKGYRRLGVRHERLATVYRDERWEIRDNLVFSRPGEHLFRLHWLLPDWGYRIRESPFELLLRAPHGKVTLHIESEPPLSQLAPRVSLVRAGQLLFGEGRALPIDGWVSPTYGKKLPALSLAVEVRASRTVSFVTQFTLPKAAARKS
jgi:hypothetical protein